MFRSCRSRKSGFLSKTFSIKGLIDVLLFGSCVVTITGFLSKFGWILDLTSHFRVQYCVIQLLCLVFFIITRRRKLLLVALLFGGINIIQIVPWYIRDLHSTDTNRAIVGKVGILLINVDTSNTNYNETIQYIKEINPDVLALEEINNRASDVTIYVDTDRSLFS